MVLVEIAFAADPAPSAAVIKITKDDWDKAHLDKEACIGTAATSLGSKLFNATNHQLNTGWMEVLPNPSKARERIQGCYIRFNGANNGSDGISGRNQNVIDVETMIKNLQPGQSLSSTQFQEWAKQDLTSKQAGASISAVFGQVLESLLNWVAVALAQLTAIAGKLFSMVVNGVMQDSRMPQAVDIGWGIIRDLSNMLFIIVLIVIALAAILRIEEYDYRHLLGELIIMAILVNFSKLIATTLIDFVNFIALIFYGDGFGFTNIYSTLMKISGIGGSLSAIAGGGPSTVAMSGGVSAAVVAGFGKIIYMIVGFAVFIMLAGMFIIRTVGLYVLVIFSPIAYVASILPSTHHFGQEWWQHFIKYLIWAPVSLFLLRICFVVADSSVNVIFGADSAMTYYILCAFMIAAVLVAEESGMAGGKAIVGAVEKGVHGAAHWVGHTAGHYAGRKWNEWSNHVTKPHDGSAQTNKQRLAFALLNPVAAFKGASKRAEELSHHASAVATARGQEIVERAMTGTNLPYEQFEERKAENEKLKFLGDMKKEQLMQYLVEAEKIKGHEGEVARLSAMKAAASNGYMDDVLRMGQFANKYGELITDPSTGKKYSLLSSPDTIQRFLKGYLGDSHGHVGEQGMRFIAEDMEELGKNTHHPEYLGHAYYDVDEKRFKMGMKVVGSTTNVNGDAIEKYENHHQAEYAGGEWEKLKANDLITTAPHGMTPQLAEVVTDASGHNQIVTSMKRQVDAAGHPVFDTAGDAVMVPVTGGTEVQNIVLGNMSVTGSSAKMYKKIYGLFSEERVLDRIQNIQVRTKDRLLSSQIDEDYIVHDNGTRTPVPSDEYGAIVVKDPIELKKIKEKWEYKPDGIKAMYAEKLNIDPKSRNKLTNVRIRYTGPDVTIDGVSYTRGVQYIDKGENAQSPNIKMIVNGARQGGGAPEPKAGEPPRPPRPATRSYINSAGETITISNTRTPPTTS